MKIAQLLETFDEVPADRIANMSDSQYHTWLGQQIKVKSGIVADLNILDDRFRNKSDPQHKKLLDYRSKIARDINDLRREQKRLEGF